VNPYKARTPWISSSRMQIPSRNPRTNSWRHDGIGIWIIILVKTKLEDVLFHAFLVGGVAWAMDLWSLRAVKGGTIVMVSAMESKPEVTSWCKSTRTFIYFLLLGIFYSELSLLINSGCALKYILFFSSTFFLEQNKLIANANTLQLWCDCWREHYFWRNFLLIFIFIVWRMNFPDRLPDKNHSSEKLSFVIYGMSIIILSKDLLTDTTRKKKINPLHSTKISIDEYNISPT
jgi:hypothetical protein